MTKKSNSPRFAPVALFAYRRVDLLNAVLDSLEACPEFAATDIFVFSDGPKADAARADVEAVRALIRDRLRPNMQIIEAPTNRGLSRSIIGGVTQLCADYGRAIVIEDDLIVSPALLTWFNAALTRFSDEPRIMQVSGHMFNSSGLASREEGVCLPMITSWGWATWDRAWKTFDPEVAGWEVLNGDRAMQRRFNLDGAYPYTNMLRRQMAGEIDSWAIRWNWTLFRNNGLALYPPQSMVANEGMDIGATHRGIGGKLRRALAYRRLPLRMTAPMLPGCVEVDPSVYAMAKRSIWRATSKLSPYHWFTR